MNLIKNALAQSPQAPDSLEASFDFARVNGFSSLGAFVDRVMPLIFSIAGLMVSFYFIIGAFELITSQGDKGHIVSARSKIYHSLIGLVLLMALFLTMQYVIPAIIGSEDGLIF